MADVEEGVEILLLRFNWVVTVLELHEWAVFSSLNNV